MIKSCKLCVAIDTRPGLEIDKDNICFPCKIIHNKIDWESRRIELNGIVNDIKKNTLKSDYDCIISVSGGKDSTRQALIVRDLGLKPLLVCCSFPPEQQTELGVNNLENLIKLGFDCITVTPSPKKYKLLMKKSFFKYANWARPTEMALYATAPRIAINYKIPYIFLGENNALTYGDVGGSLGGDANKIKYNNTLSGGIPTEYMSKTMTKSDVLWHHFPSDLDLEKAKIKIIYLGYYFKDFNNFKNTEIAVKNGLKLKINKDSYQTGSVYNNDALDDDFVHVNQLLKYLKLGFAKVTDEVSEAIRLGLLSRNDGIDLIKKYDGKCSYEYIEKYCDFLEISQTKFWNTAIKNLNNKIWDKKKGGLWTLNHPLYKRDFKIYNQ